MSLVVDVVSSCTGSDEEVSQVVDVLEIGVGVGSLDDLEHVSLSVLLKTEDKY